MEKILINHIKNIVYYLAYFIPLKKNSVLFFVPQYGSGNRTNINPIYEELKKDKNIKIKRIDRKANLPFLKKIITDIKILFQLLRYRVIVSACGMSINTIKNITVEIQHGIIPTDHPAYIYKKKLNKKIYMSDYLITYGNYEKELLTKHSIWNEEQVLPFGCPRYDFLVNYKIDKEKLKEKLNIPKNKKILFWPTQTHDKPMIESGETELNTDETFSAIKKNKDWFLLIKTHPNEEVAKSKKFYEQYKRKHKLNNFKFLKFSDLSTYDCILLSNLVISKASTVNMEALLLDKFVLNFDLVKSYDLSQFEIIGDESILKEKGQLNQFLQNYEKNYKIQNRKIKEYQKNHFNNFGKSTKKIIEFIKKINHNKFSIF